MLRTSRKIESPLFIRLSSTVCLIIFLSVFNSEGDCLPVIPDDVNQGDSWVSSGLINYHNWSIIRPYYENKINIPTEGFSTLESLFPECDCNHPESKELNQYSPWSKDMIDSFYNSYPQYQNITPILSFNREIGVKRVSLKINSSFENSFKTTSSNLKSCISPVDAFSFKSSITYEDSIIRWNRRVLEIYPSKNSLVKVGNFSFKLDDGNNYGYLPYSSKPDSTAIQNWLYTSNSQWNGIFASLKKENSTLLVIAHKRKSETIGAIKYQYLKGTIKFNNIISADIINEKGEKDTSISNIINLTYKSDKASISISSLINSLTGSSFPILVKFSRYSKSTRHNASVNYFPRYFKRPRSSTYRYLSYRLGEYPTEDSDVLLLKNGITLNRKRKLYHSNNTTILINSLNYYIKEELNFYLKNRVSPQLRVRIDKSKKYTRMYNSIELPFELNKKITLTGLYKVYLNADNYVKNSWKGVCRIETRRIILSPSLEYNRNNENINTFTLTLNSQINISHKSYGYYKISFKPKNEKPEQLKIYLGQSFCF